VIDMAPGSDEEAVGEAAVDPGLRRHVKEDSVKVPRELMRRSPGRAIAYLAFAHLWIALAVAAARLVPGGPVAVMAVCFPLLLVAQRCLQTLVHHASHDLFSKRRPINDGVTNYLVAGFIGMTVQNYRRVHFRHHAENGSANDPEFIDFAAVRARGGLLRYILRFAAGGEALALVKKYYAAPRASGARSSTRRPALIHVAVAQLALVAVFWFAADAWYLYGLWLYLAVTWSPLLSRLRFLVEHPGTDERTVSTRAGWHEVVLFAPFQFNYHFEHHVWPGLPPYRLGRMHRQLTDGRFFDRHPEYVGRSFIGSLLSRSADR
jgi:fatty acid desaturase